MDITSFEKHWRNYSDAIESLLIRQASSGHINIQFANEEIIFFSRRWQKNNSIEGLWISNLAEKDPTKANRVIQAITDFRLKEIPFRMPSMLVFYLLVALIGGASLAVVFMLSLVAWKLILIPVLCVIFAYGFFIPLGNSKREKARKDIVAAYMQQVEKLKHSIDTIIME